MENLTRVCNLELSRTLAEIDGREKRVCLQNSDISKLISGIAKTMFCFNLNVWYFQIMVMKCNYFDIFFNVVVQLWSSVCEPVKWKILHEFVIWNSRGRLLKLFGSEPPGTELIL